MDSYQPSLWDHVALENGYKLLSDLNLEEAIAQFNEALLSPIGDRLSEILPPVPLTEKIQPLNASWRHLNNGR